MNSFPFLTMKMNCACFRLAPKAASPYRYHYFVSVVVFGVQKTHFSQILAYVWLLLSFCLITLYLRVRNDTVFRLMAKNSEITYFLNFDLL